MGKFSILVVILLCLQGLASSASGENTSMQTKSDLRRSVPSTVSAGWKTFFEQCPDPTKENHWPAATDLESWAKLRLELDKPLLEAADQLVKQYGVSVESKTFDGVPILEVKPKDWKDNGKVLVHIHGGAFTLFSARSSLRSSALVASTTGLRIISIDYSCAPAARWQEILQQVLTVFRSLQKQGIPVNHTAIYGDSAGGALAAGAVLKMRDSGMGMPRAIILWSPWADITETGDTYTTLRDAEPCYTYERELGPSAAAYADPADQKNPYVSPVYGDFSKGFPPTLIQGGTRELLLSGFVRLFQAIDNAQQKVKLDIYEGMPHVFQFKLPQSKEAQTALGKMTDFLKQNSF